MNEGQSGTCIRGALEVVEGCHPSNTVPGPPRLSEQERCSWKGSSADRRGIAMCSVQPAEGGSTKLVRYMLCRKKGGGVNDGMRKTIAHRHDWQCLGHTSRGIG